MIFTLEKTIKKYKVKFSQNLHYKWPFGHYHWYIENKNGDIVAAGFSSGSPPDKITKRDLDKCFERWEPKGEE